MQSPVVLAISSAQRKRRLKEMEANAETRSVFESFEASLRRLEERDLETQRQLRESEERAQRQIRESEERDLETQRLLRDVRDEFHENVTVKDAHNCSLLALVGSLAWRIRQLELEMGPESLQAPPEDLYG